jgi:ABC-type transport system involved in multi-copper enzyme maturation permease subunit
MMLRIAAQEFRYMFKSPQTFVAFSIFFLLTFFAMISSNVQIGGGGNVLVNSPHAITETLLIMNVFAVFVVPSFIANAFLKDVDFKFDGILFATPISKTDYLFGRFLGAFAAMMIALLGTPLGMFIGTFWYSVDPETLGPTNIAHFIYIYGVLIIPSMLAISSIMYAMAVITRSIMSTYLTAMGLLILYLVGQSLLQAPEYRTITALLDPFLIDTFQDITRYWTAVERNTTLISYEGVLLTNRIIWAGITAIFVFIAYFTFSFRTEAKLKKEKLSKKELSELARKEEIKLGVKVTPTWSGATIFRQFMLRTRFEVSSVFKSLPFLIIVGFNLFIMIMALFQRNIGYGLDAYPVTRLMVQAVQEGMGLALIVVIIFYSADIIWRERNAKFNEIIDALPTPSWVFVASKLLALSAILVSLLILGVLIAIVVQVANGFSSIDMGMYIHRGIIHFVSGFILVAVLAVFVQVISKNRFIGMMIMVVYLISSITLSLFGFEHPLYQFAIGIDTPMSDMNGSGRFLIGDYWFFAYWAAFSVLLLMLSYFLWNRGTLQPLKLRIGNLRNFKKPLSGSVAFLALVSFVGTGSYIYYNTNILNDYVTIDDMQESSVEYETLFRQYENLPQPRIVGVKMNVDIYPYQRRVESKGSHVLENKTNAPIETIHMVFPPNVDVPFLELEGGTLSSLNQDYSYYIFDLATPMQPGDKLNLSFEILIAEKGFLHRRNNVALVRNGTFINNGDIAPYIGFAPQGMISDRNMRRKHGLEPLPRTPKLEDQSQHTNNYLRQDSDFVSFETTVSTVASQTVVAPGYIEAEWVEGDRRYFTYKMDAPILNFYSYLSAEYEVVSEQWNDVLIEVFHHEPHTYNVARMVESVKDSITYFNRVFSPYQHRQLRILEFPSYRNFAQAFPNTVPYSEGIGFIAEIAGEDEIDLPYYVTAHEVAHQWWAHQVMSANTQGGTMLIETLAQYSALLVMEEKYGKDNIRKFLKYELDRYLSGRATDPEGEMPLYRVENQQYIHYRKGAVIMYALKDYLGEDVVNRSLSRLIDLRGFSSDPYAISTDLLKILKEEAKPEQTGLIEDFLEKITIYDIKVTNGTVRELDDGRFAVLIDVDLSKIYADAEGNETEAEFDISVDVGIFNKSPAEGDFSSDNVIYMSKHSVSGAEAVIEVIVDERPTFVGVDPYNKLIDRDSNDNLIEVEEQTQG